MGRSVGEGELNASFFSPEFLAELGTSGHLHPAPQGSGVNGAGIPVPQQQMQLMRIQRASAAAIGFGPSGEAPLRKPFLAEPKTLTVVHQAFD